MKLYHTVTVLLQLIDFFVLVFEMVQRFFESTYKDSAVREYVLNVLSTVCSLLLQLQLQKI